MTFTIEGSDSVKIWRFGFHFYIIGILILTLGVALSIQSQLGTSPLDAFLVGMYRTFGLSIGSWEIIVGCTLLFGNALLEKKRPEYFALLTTFITGIGIDLWMLLLRNNFFPETVLGQWVYLMSGITLTAFGVALYLQSEIAPNPMDRTMLLITKLTGWSVSYSRAFISVVFVILALFCSGPIGIGTLINAFISGIIINFFLPYLQHLRELINQKWITPIPQRLHEK